MDTTQLLSAIKNCITVPNYQNRFSTTDLLTFADEELRTTVMEVLVTNREEYNITFEDIALTSSTVYVDIPSYILGQTVRALKYQNSSNSSFIEMVRIEIEDANPVLSQQSACPYYYFMDDKIYLSFSPGNSSKIRMYYRRKHSALTSTANTISIVSASGFDFVCSDAPPANITAGSYIDLAKGTANYGFKATNKQVASVSGSTITMVDNVDGYLAAANDVISLNGYTSLVQIPDEAWQILVQAVAVRVIEALNVPEQYQIADAMLKSKIDKFLSITKPRAADSLPTIINPNGLLRRGNRRFPAVSV